MSSPVLLSSSSKERLVPIGRQPVFLHPAWSAWARFSSPLHIVSPDVGLVVEASLHECWDEC